MAGAELAASGKLAVNRALRSLLSNSIEAAGLPRLWRYLDALPVNAQGKTAYAELIALLDRERPLGTKPRRRLIEKSAQRAVFELWRRAICFISRAIFQGGRFCPA